MLISLRPYQDQAIARVLEAFTRVARVLLTLPTGGGKTVVATALIRSFVERGLRVVFLAHRREIIKQSFAKLVRGGLSPEQVGIIMAGTPWRLVDGIAPPVGQCTDEELWSLYGRRRPTAPVQVGSIDTFRNHVHPPADLIIVDEAHRALAKSYCDVQLAYPQAKHLGLTATPLRADNKPLSHAYDELVVAATFAELVELGSLVAPLCYGVPPSKRIDLAGVRRSGGDYKTEDLAKAVDKTELVGDIVDHWRRLGNDAPTFCFAVNVAHSRHLAERFKAAGIAAAHVDGNTETTERDDAIAALRAGRVKVLSNCNVFTEGTDVPAVKTIILARPTLSEALYLQQAGRGSRPTEDGAPFVVLDHAGCCRPRSEGGFGLPQDDRQWSLEARPKRGKASASLVPPTKDCPGCYALVPPATRTCPGCGYEFPAPDPKALEEAAGELVALNAAPAAPALTARQGARLEQWNAIVERWRAENEALDAAGKPLRAGGWCIYQWRNETGQTWPPKGSSVPKLTAEELARNAERKPDRRAVARGEQADFGHAASVALEEWTL